MGSDRQDQGGAAPVACGVSPGVFLQKKKHNFRRIVPNRAGFRVLGQLSFEVET